MRKYILCIICCICLLTSCTGETLVKKEEIKNIYIEIINEEDKKIDKIEIKEKDVDKIKEILSNEKTRGDSGFVFAEGKYRIILEKEASVIKMYPYCGNIETIRVGDRSEKYIELKDEEVKQLEEIVYKYIDDGKAVGIWEWSEYGEKE